MPKPRPVWGHNAVWIARSAGCELELYKRSELQSVYWYTPLRPPSLQLPHTATRLHVIMSGLASASGESGQDSACRTMVCKAFPSWATQWVLGTALRTFIVAHHSSW